jgi:hypothetical protein
MNEMKTPGFTAEASLCKTSECYQLEKTWTGNARGNVVPTASVKGKHCEPNIPEFDEITCPSGWAEWFCNDRECHSTKKCCDAPGCKPPCICSMEFPGYCTQHCFRYDAFGQPFWFTQRCLPPGITGVGSPFIA